jgi:hypothetical protein
MRRCFFRMMHQDLNAIFDGLRELEQKGVATIDCRRAQFSAEEPILRLRMICQSWKVMFQAEYSSGQPLRMLVDMRAAIDDALGRGLAQTAALKSGKKASPVPSPKPAMAARAAANGPSPSKFKVSADAAPEFEVSGADAGEWNPGDGGKFGG